VVNLQDVGSLVKKIEAYTAEEQQSALLTNLTTILLSMMTRSQTKYERTHAIEYGNYILEELATETDIDHISSLLMEIISSQALHWRIQYEIDFRKKVRAQCEAYVEALKTERNVADLPLSEPTTKIEWLKHRANIILKDSAKY